MVAEVIFYQLSAKFVENEQRIPDDAQDVMYYTLAIGHHTGVMDCFTPKLRSSTDLYNKVISFFPQGDARYKLEGISRFGEIQIDKSHISLLLPAVQAVLLSLYTDESAKTHIEEITWLTSFEDILKSISSEPAIYVMGRKIV
ncbi:MAG: formate hydrogenlyase maturation protein HycH [Raoultibacter sp.]